MPTEADFQAAFEDMKNVLNTTLDTEIQQVLDALAAPGVPQSAIDSVTAFRDSFKARIEGVVVPPAA